jgi:hypothetical protein
MYTIKYASEEARQLCGKAWKEDQVCCISGCEDKATKLVVSENHSLYLLCHRGFHLTDLRTQRP